MKQNGGKNMKKVKLVFLKEDKEIVYEDVKIIKFKTGKELINDGYDAIKSRVYCVLVMNTGTATFDTQDCFISLID